MIVAAHVPIVNRFLLHAKLAAYRSYVVGIDLGGDAGVRRRPVLGHGASRTTTFARRRSAGGATCWSAVRTTRSARPTTRRRRSSGWKRTCACASGATSRRPTTAGRGRSWRRPTACPTSGATRSRTTSTSRPGYAGNGITQGTLAAMVLADQIAGRDNPLGELLDATRIKPLASAGAVLSENLDYPEAHAGRSAAGQRRPARRRWRRSRPARGGCCRLGGERLAVYRNAQRAARRACRRCARTSAAWFTGTPPRRAGTARATAAASIPHGRVLNGPAVAALEAKPIPGLAAELEREQEAESPTHDLHEHAATDWPPIGADANEGRRRRGGPRRPRLRGGTQDNGAGEVVAEADGAIAE